MIYLYDNALADDLRRSFKSCSGETFVRVVDPEESISLAGQLQDDKLSFPLVAIFRNSNTPIDTSQTNFTRLHSGKVSSFDSKTNTIWYERSIPINLNYSFTILTTRVADLDEIIKEIIFKYSTMYFLSISLPYESNRVIRFGVEIDSNQDIERTSSVSEYLSQGRLYQAIIPIKCYGCVLVSYRPRIVTQIDQQYIDSNNLFSK